MKKDENGWVIYDTKKGEFIWDKDVQPEYSWFNGEVSYTMMNPFDPNEVVYINQLNGSPDDPNSRIWPFKVFRGIQPYDAAITPLSFCTCLVKTRQLTGSLMTGARPSLPVWNMLVTNTVANMTG